MKAGKDKSIKTLTPNVSLTFVGGAAPTVSNTNFEILNSGTGPHGDFINLLHTEKISVAGIQVEDLSMTSVGTAIVPLATLAKQDTGHAIDVRDMHIVSTAPVGDVVTTVAALNLGIYDLAPIDMTRVLMCSITDYSSDPSGGLNLINRGSSAWGGATSFSTDLIYVYRYPRS